MGPGEGSEELDRLCVVLPVGCRLEGLGIARVDSELLHVKPVVRLIRRAVLNRAHVAVVLPDRSLSRGGGGGGGRAKARDESGDVCETAADDTITKIRLYSFSSYWNE